MTFLNWLGAGVFVLGVWYLMPLARNWAGMSRDAALDRIDKFNKAHKRPGQRPGFPPFLLDEGIYLHEDVLSTDQGVMFFLVNLLIGLSLGFFFWKDGTYLYAAGGTMVVEYFILLGLQKYLRRTHEKNWQKCMKLYAANSRLVGQLVDHNTHKDSITLPPNGRIITVRFRINEGESLVLNWCTMFQAGCYELDVWLPQLHYTGIPWGIFSRTIFDRDVTTFLSSCVEDPQAPPGVKWKLVGVCPEIYGSRMLPHDVLTIRGSVMKVGLEECEMSLDDYVRRRASREVDCG